MGKPVRGKLGVAPCNHIGEYIIGQFVQCLEGCEANAADAPPIEHCPYCKSSNVDSDYSLGQQYLFWNPTVHDLDRRCFDCGHCWQS